MQPATAKVDLPLTRRGQTGSARPAQRGWGARSAAPRQRWKADEGREAFFASQLGITGVDYLVAETGSAVMLARPDQPRSTSLLPVVHIAVAERSQIVADLFDLFERLAERGAQPSSATLITGPSKTGDIELKLVTGVHGPGEFHVVVVKEMMNDER